MSEPVQINMGTNYSDKAFEAIQDWEQSTKAQYLGGPFFARSFGDEGFVIFEIKNWYDGLALSLIKTPPEYRGKGLAGRALKELLSFADKHGVPVTGSADPQKDKGKTLNKSQLKSWYKRYGFKFDRDEMTRPPQNQQAAKVVEALLEADDFDAKEYLLDTPPTEAFVNEMQENNWTPGDLESKWGMEFVKDEYEVNGVLCNLKVYIHPEFPHEAHITVQANYTDDNGFEHWQNVDQDLFWEMNQGEGVQDYCSRISDDVARKVRVPDTYEPERLDDEDWYRDR